ncbi:hypothetical protein JAAARDRAFT_155890 [Jaapia argillacea MUCL 33604]|uniref:FCP1 homology domain-containing protein n=1 Tax=Jaapia argillacea MUCL 33604 TaxID=933084 RepID=A0A067Q3Y1_9AGAM|nr:hypothetical protein JAAARDRAFT_155890 [Jaapia argillacea MUCL 33604]
MSGYHRRSDRGRYNPSQPTYPNPYDPDYQNYSSQASSSSYYDSWDPNRTYRRSYSGYGYDNRTYGNNQSVDSGGRSGGGNGPSYRQRRPSPSYNDYDQYVVHDPSSSSPSRARSRSSSPRPLVVPPSLNLPVPSLPKRSPTPLEPPTTRPPSPTYLATTLLPSSRLSEPTSTRKLLILDLNGTLLIRAAHQSRSRFPVQPLPPSSSSQGLPPPSSAQLSSSQAPSAPRTSHPNSRPPHPSGPRLRPVHPRPYMQTFRNYLFHPSTQTWLDTMVWSSAQPHSVDDMVEKCFGEHRRELKAVWARDTLGLSPNQYHRKTQTTKDLTKPWAHLSSLSSPPTEPTSDADSSTPSAPTPPSQIAPTSSPQIHSALTTLLLDDSPLKAQIQPYNHVCIKEYSQELRRGDVELVELERDRERELELAKEVEAEKAKELVDELEKAKGVNVEQAVITGDPSSPTPQEVDATFPLTKKRKRPKNKKKPTQSTSGQKYDETLLAVIGVLDEIKYQSNVAGWIRNGGLFQGVGGEGVVEGKEVRAGAVDGVDEEQSSRESSPGVEDGHQGKRVKPRGDSLPLDPPTPGNDLTMTVEPATTGPSEPDPETKLWFHHQDTMKFWVERGRKACEELGIEVVHGVDR